MANEGAWLTVVGVGPGDPAYLTPAACRAATAAQILIGGPRALSLFRELEREKRTITGNLEDLYSYLLQVRGRPTAVLVSGDPGFYSILGWLKRRFPGEKIQVIPGISSIQLAFARLGYGWEEAVFLSLHGRPLTVLDPYLPGLREGSARLALLTGGTNTPAAIGRYLCEHSLAATRMWVGVDLGGPGEKTGWYTAAELAGQPLIAPAVVITGYEAG